MSIVIYTDGSSNFNGKPNCVGGWSFAIPNFKGKTFIRYGHLPAKSSNNKGEIMGVLYAMHLLQKYPGAIEINSDSQYVVKANNEWRKKWVKTKYEGIANKKMLVPLFDLIDNHGNVSLNWVRGHNGNAGNELADEYAGLGMRQVIREKIDDRVDIRYITHDRIPYECND